MQYIRLQRTPSHSSNRTETEMRSSSSFDLKTYLDTIFGIARNSLGSTNKRSFLLFLAYQVMIFQLFNFRSATAKTATKLRQMKDKPTSWRISNKKVREGRGDLPPYTFHCLQFLPYFHDVLYPRCATICNNHRY